MTVDLNYLPTDAAIRAQQPLTAQPRPFLRWAGSKRRLLVSLLPHLPCEFGRYWEPFLGSGALFFLLQPTIAHLSDSCQPLVRTFRAVRDGPRATAHLAHQWPVTRKDFYYVRSLRPASRFEQAARFIYLNKTCWNGLYRVNSKGRFNVPFGRPKSSRVTTREDLTACAKALRHPGISLGVSDFEDTLAPVSEGDLVYLDPPYMTQHNNNGFVDYNEKLFTWNDQRRLASTAAKLRRLGATVLVSNALHRDLIDLYPDFHVQQLQRFSTLAGDATKRSPVVEALFVGKAMQ